MLDIFIYIILDSNIVLGHNCSMLSTISQIASSYHTLNCMTITRTKTVTEVYTNSAPRRKGREFHPKPAQYFSREQHQLAYMGGQNMRQ